MASIDQVLNQMQANGLPLLPTGHPKLDGKFHRFGPKKKFWYALREVVLKSGATMVHGAFGAWQGANNNAVPVTIDWRGISPEERAAAEQKQREYEEAEQKQREQLARAAANRARTQWNAASDIVPGIAPKVPSSYLQRKQVDIEKARVTADGTLLVPMMKYSHDGAYLVGLQKIAPDGNKMFNKGMEKVGAACLLGSLHDDTSVLIMVEGYATAASIRAATGKCYPAMVAFDAGNLLAVAQSVRKDFPNIHILFAADDDWQLERRFFDRMAEDFKLSCPVLIDGTEQTLQADDGTSVQITPAWRQDVNGVAFIEADVRTDRQVRTLKFENAGIAKAKAAAAVVGNASVVWPCFEARGENKWTDFNDLQVEQSPQAVTEQIMTAVDVALAAPRASPPALTLVHNSPAPSPEKAEPASEEAESKGKGKKERPKRIYPQSHWDTVNFLLDNFVLIYGDDTAWDRQSRMIIKIAHMRLAYTSDAVKFWLNNPDRKMVHKDAVVFDPTRKCDPDTHVNLYHGFEMQPNPGKCEKIRELLHHLCGGDTEVMAWVLRWIAYPLQHKGAKMRTSIIIHGDEGSGKNLFWENVVRRIYGEYGGVIGNAQIESQFNEWASKKLFFVADEVVTRNELRQLKGKLKHMVTGETIMINPKGFTERAEANHMNFVFLSNELQPLVLDKTDRRYLVLWTPPNKPAEFYKAVADEIDNGGVEAFYDYVMKVPLADFDEHSKPIMTEAKIKLIGLGLSPPERFYREWAGGFLPLPFVCCSAGQLYLGFLRWCHLNGERFPMTQAMFGRTIDRVGFGQVSRAVIKYDLAEEVKQRTVYLVGDQPAGKGRSDWVRDTSEIFEKCLKKYRHVYDQPSDVNS